MTEDDVFFETKKRLAENGDSEAQVFLGNLCKKNNKLEEAASWLKKAAIQENPKAQYAIGEMYEAGEGVPENYSTAIDWYKKAARNGSTLAQEKLRKYHEAW